MFGLFVGTAAILGFALTPLSIAWRVIYGIASLLIVVPPDPFGVAGYTINIIGIGMAIALLVIENLRRRAAAAPSTAERRFKPTIALRGRACRLDRHSDPLCVAKQSCQAFSRQMPSASCAGRSEMENNTDSFFA
jgi:hypothetical protein